MYAVFDKMNSKQWILRGVCIWKSLLSAKKTTQYQLTLEYPVLAVKIYNSIEEILENISSDLFNYLADQLRKLWKNEWNWIDFKNYIQSNNFDAHFEVQWNGNVEKLAR